MMPTFKHKACSLEETFNGAPPILECVGKLSNKISPKQTAFIFLPIPNYIEKARETTPVLLNLTQLTQTNST